MKRLDDGAFTKVNGPSKKTVQSMTLFETPDIFYKFISNDHHKCRCKAAIDQTFQ